MDRIFMTQLGGVDREHRVNLGVFIKGEKEHLEELIGFLANQNIDCVEFSPKAHDSLPEFGYFNEGFKIRISPYRWTFYELSEGIILAEFARYGFEKKNLAIETDYSKLGSFDINNLLAVRSRYDGIILGPMPHKMKGDYKDGSSLVAMMENEPARYPPFAVARDKSKELKITKSSLRDALSKLSAMIEKVGQFGMAA